MIGFSVEFQHRKVYKTGFKYVDANIVVNKQCWVGLCRRHGAD